jgi:secreted Zn-dependent insulinase-like peptidase
VYRLESSEKLLQFAIGQPEDSQKAEFCRGLHPQSLRITFDSEIAEKDKSITFLHVRHFFIRAIVEAHRQGEGSFHPVARVGLDAADDLPPGD